MSHASSNFKTLKILDAEALELPLGGEAMVELTGTQRRFKSTFLGMERGQFILLKPPQTRQLLDVLTPRLDLTVRFLLHGGRICGFHSQISHLSHKPYPLLFLTYPGQVELLRLRKHERVACYQPIVFYMCGEEQHGVIVNISAGGCRVLMEHGPLEELAARAPGEQLVFQFRPFGADEQVYLQGIAKTASLENGKLSLGVAFQDLEPELARKIDKYVEIMQAYQPR